MSNISIYGIVLALAGALLMGCAGEASSTSESAQSNVIQTTVRGVTFRVIESARELIETSEAVVAVRPAGRQEFMKEIDGVAFYAQPAQVIDSFSGPLQRGDRINIVRTVYGPSPETRDRLTAEALAAGRGKPTFESTDHGLSYSRGLYVLGLIDSDGFYGREAWTLNDERQGYIPFKVEGNEPYGDATVADPGEHEPGPLHMQWRGDSYQRVREELQGASQRAAR